MEEEHQQVNHRIPSKRMAMAFTYIDWENWSFLQSVPLDMVVMVMVKQNMEFVCGSGCQTSSIYTQYC